MPDPIGQAACWLASGGLLAYPTETIWGLGADARSAEALERLCRWKRRAASEPVALLVENAERAAQLGFQLGPAARRLAEAFWPGPLTLVVPSRDEFAPGVARDDGAVGLRCSAHPLAEALARRLRLAGIGPITATSLNRSGEPPAAGLATAQALCGEGPDEPRLIEGPRLIDGRPPPPRGPPPRPPRAKASAAARQPTNVTTIHRRIDLFMISPPQGIVSVVGLLAHDRDFVDVRQQLAVLYGAGGSGGRDTRY